MTQYVDQLIHDITEAKLNLAWPYLKQAEVDLHDWKSREDEATTAPVRNLPAWTGITPEMLPPSARLNDEQVFALLNVLTELLTACNCHVVFQTQVPERFKYEVIRQNFDQNIKLLQWNDEFFAFCKPGTPTKTCVLGEYCQCAFFEGLFEGFVEEDLTREEARARDLEFEVRHIKKKYGDDWMKYYPYHLDKSYDDEYGNPYDYGMGSDDEEDRDDWWRK